MNISKSTLARTIILALALLNQCLSISGHSIIPIADEDIEQFVSLAFTIVSALIAWWKNNSFTQNAIKADEMLKELKENSNE